jgi:hypothetical protein
MALAPPGTAHNIPATKSNTAIFFIPGSIFVSWFSNSMTNATAFQNLHT